jgi:GTP diphosphokinase / guanosine-3',5'-bis(diphosphate) 3'-diphosphatase
MIAGNEVVALARAYALAAERHAGQRRKGRAAEPYVNHLAEVAALVAEATGGRDAGLVAAAVLHDALEDTATSEAELAAAFGGRVAALVREVTDDKSLPKAERKRRQVADAPGKSAGAKMIKLADKASNLRALVASPPESWDADRRREYLRWARGVAAGLRGVSPALEAGFDDAASALERALDATAGP